MTWWRSISFRMVLGTAVLLLVVLGAVYGWRYRVVVAERFRELEDDATLTAKVILRSFETAEPGGSSAHTDTLARNLIDLPDIHNIQVVAATGNVAYSHHAEEIGRRFDPTRDAPCSDCHTREGVTTNRREYLGRQGQPLFHRGFAIPNRPPCQRCHDAGYRNLGMLLVSFELGHYHADLARWRTSLLWSGAGALLVAVVAIAALFALLVRRPLARLEAEIRCVEAGDFAHAGGVAGSGEIAAAHRAFLRMSDRLRDAQASLEARVQQGSRRIDSLSGELELLYSNLMHLEHLSAVGTLSAQMAHEVRTPLNALGLNLQLLERGLARVDGVEPSLVELLSDMGHETRRVVDVLQQFMARVRRPAPDAAPELLGPVLHSAVFLMTAEARRAGVSLEIEASDLANERALRANPLRQVLTNLLSNAIRATPRGGRVRLSAEVDPDRRLVLRVEDSGPGVPPDLRERVFEPFFTTRADGTGLGLAIVRRIVAESGGSIEVGDSDLGGASFRVRWHEGAPA